MRQERLRHQFVEYMPERLEEGVLYVSIPFATVSHLCCCGCRMEVVTPLSPTDWRLIFDGKSVSLHPSIGNWSFECRSHYWIRRGKVHWARSWSREEIDLGRAMDRRRKARYYRPDLGPDDEPPRTQAVTAPRMTDSPRGFWAHVRSWFPAGRR